jgi:hypothetical protein
VKTEEHSGIPVPKFKSLFTKKEMAVMALIGWCQAHGKYTDAKIQIGPAGRAAKLPYPWYGTFHDILRKWHIREYSSEHASTLMGAILSTSKEAPLDIRPWVELLDGPGSTVDEDGDYDMMDA